MNEYKQNENDISSSSDNSKKKCKSRTIKPLFWIIVAIIIITAFCTVVICSISFTIMINKYAASKSLPFVNNEAYSNRDNVPIVPHRKTNEILTPQSLLDNVVTVSVDAKGGFLNQSATVCSGNGIFIRDGGYILTSAYIMESKGNLIVTLNNGEQCSAAVHGTDDERYISLLKIEKPEQGSVAVGNSDDVKIGDSVIGVGNKLSENFKNPITFGAVCGYDADITLKDGSLVNVFQTDAADISDSIGGLLFNYKGELIGINTAKYAVSSSDIALVTPINDIIEYANAIMDNTTIEKTKKLGISATDEDYGVIIDNVEKDSLAEKAGLKHGDLIIQINNEPVKALAQIVKTKNGLSVGDEMNFTIYRDGVTIDIKVILE